MPSYQPEAHPKLIWQRSLLLLLLLLLLAILAAVPKGIARQ